MGMKKGLFLDCMFNLFDENGDGAISFCEFICGLSILCMTADHREKLRFSFQIYDLDRDKKISREDLTRMLEESLRENKLAFRKELIEQLVEDTFAEADTNKDGFIDFDEYCALYESHPQMLANMTVNIQEKIARARMAVAKAAGGDAAGDEGGKSAALESTTEKGTKTEA